MKYLPLCFTLLFCHIAHAQKYDVEKFGSFIYSTLTDDFDDSVTHVFITEDTNNQGALGWICSEGELRISLMLGTYMIGQGGEYIKVRHRFDDEEGADWETWELDNTNEIADMMVVEPVLDNREKFTKKAIVGNKLIMQASDPIGGEKVRYTFYLSGFTRGKERMPCLADIHADVVVK